METNFDFTRDSLYRISGSGLKDADLAKKAASKMLDFIEERKNNIDSYSSFKKVITASSFNDLYNDLTMMNYFCIQLTELAGFFRSKSDMHSIFEERRSKGQALLDDAKKDVSRLRTYIIKPRTSQAPVRRSPARRA